VPNGIVSFMVGFMRHDVTFGPVPTQVSGLVPQQVVRVCLPIPLQSLVVVRDGTREYSRAKSASDGTSIAKAAQ
jgi:hypothetical protein